MRITAKKLTSAIYFKAGEWTKKNEVGLMEAKDFGDITSRDAVPA